VTTRTILLSPNAVRQFNRLIAKDRARFREALRAALAEDDATVETRNRFRLRRPTPRAEFELRAGDLRAFYRVERSEVRITVIGKKIRNVLIVEGRRFTI
jgi:hypothetical protein